MLTDCGGCFLGKGPRGTREDRILDPSCQAPNLVIGLRGQALHLSYETGALSQVDLLQ